MHLSTTTLRDLAVVVVLVADVAWEGAKDALARLRPYVEPPADLQVRSSEGALYTGILLVDRNDVLAGIVIRTGNEPPPSTGSRYTPPLTSSSRFDTPPSRSAGWRSDTLASRFADADGDDEDNDNEGRLPGWSEDTRRDQWRR